MKLVVFILVFVLFNRSALGQSTDMDLLDNEVIPLENFDDGKGAFHEAFSQANLIGLGEATHGTSEFFKIKAELIKYLITNEGFNTIIFEGSYSNSDLLNEYITHGTGSVYKAIIGLGPWCWYSEEVLDLVEWLRSYNSHKAIENRVKFYGCDMQIAKFTIDKLLTYLKGLRVVNPDLQQKLESIKPLSFKSKLNSDEIQLVQTVVDQLNMMFDKLDNQGIETEPVTVHNQRILEQWIELMKSKKNSSNKRDEFMAENIEFILSLDENTKAIIWAHNAHIAMVKDSHQTLVPMGSYLKARYGNNYFAVGFGFNSGSFNAVKGNERTVTVGNAEESSSDFQFSKSHYSRFFLNIRNMEFTIPVIHQEVKSRNIGEHYYQKGGYRYHTLAESFSGLIFVRDTEASRLLDFNLLK